MPTLRDIRQRISSVKNTAKITSAMRMVAAAKLRRAQDAIMAARPYTLKLSEVLSNLAAAADEDYFHPLLRNPDKVESIVVIVVAADRGLCGSFNANVLRGATYYIQNTLPQRFPKSTIKVIAVGRRAVNHFAKTEIPVQKNIPDVFGKLSFATALDLAELVTDAYTGETVDRVELIFNEFKSIMRQEVRTNTLLPIEKTAGNTKTNSDYLYEPSRGEIMDVLLPKFINNQIWRALLESNAAENAARMLAMENATTNAKDLIKALQLSYNKARQAAITKEMLEIVGGAEALKG